ncbi:MAG: alpha-galactosidase, partial [Clostridia bacterium]|nr:alpha-galactosidase [Clostridia bacterium]
GLRPAIWIGGTVPNKTKLYQEHPEWFMGDMLGGIDSYVLDVSRKDVREYMCSALDTMLSEYAFEGLKHDFWSYPFESPKRFYKNKSKSGYQYRNWWLTEVRKRLPVDGYMQTGCAIAMGNPFLGKYYNNYRYGIDIGEGDWENIKTLFAWGAACLATHTGDLFIPNSDSFGFFPNLPDNVFMFWTNFLLITRTAVELSGRFSKEENLRSPRFPVLKKATCNPNNGQDVYFVGFDYRKKETIPEIFYLKTSLFASEEKEVLPTRTVALFNMNKKEKTFVLTLKDLGLEQDDYVVTDVWSGERSSFGAKYTLTVGAEQSKLIAITKKSKFALYDANIRLTDVRATGDSLVARTDYGADAECILETTPCKITFNEKEIPFDYNGNRVAFSVPSAGELRFVMD